MYTEFITVLSVCLPKTIFKPNCEDIMTYVCL